MKTFPSLNDVPIGQTATVKKVHATGGMSLIENTKVKCVGQSPFGNPKAYLIRGAVIALRNEDSKKIKINEVVF